MNARDRRAASCGFDVAVHADGGGLRGYVSHPRRPAPALTRPSCAALQPTRVLLDVIGGYERAVVDLLGQTWSSVVAGAIRCQVFFFLAAPLGTLAKTDQLDGRVLALIAAEAAPPAASSTLSKPERRLQIIARCRHLLVTALVTEQQLRNPSWRPTSWPAATRSWPC